MGFLTQNLISKVAFIVWRTIFERLEPNLGETWVGFGSILRQIFCLGKVNCHQTPKILFWPNTSFHFPAVVESGRRSYAAAIVVVAGAAPRRPRFGLGGLFQQRWEVILLSFKLFRGFVDHFAGRVEVYNFGV